MKFSFKIQDYQTDAVDSVVSVFAGQPKQDPLRYLRDLGVRKPQPAAQPVQGNLFGETVNPQEEEHEASGFRNQEILPDDARLLENIRSVQGINNISLSPSLVKDLGRVSLDVEMETGTGKTYVYIKTMFELNRTYGWSKFIVVVPSIAIREGVKKSFDMTADHFMEHYGKKARFFVYDSSNLNALDTFSSEAGVSVMIINTQAFASSMKEGGRSKESRIIYTVRDAFQSRRPIDVISANRPIIILDEPQKMGGAATQQGIKNFNPLFTINYSATHKNHHNAVYVLDALDAYNKKLVKKIQVKGFEVHNLKGTDRYLYFERIVLSPNKPPLAKMEIEVKQQSGPSRKTRIFGQGDDLYAASNGMQQYHDGYSIADIDVATKTVHFVNGETVRVGEVVGDIAEKDMRRIQIRQTIISHFEKEARLFARGIKTLSLFFIDEVAKYRQYGEDGEELLGEYGRIFEEEYTAVLNENLSLFDSDYQRYLRLFDVHQIHRGYFSIDKKSGRSVNSEVKRGSDTTDDISAYDLILRNKERLLSFDEPTRFIFSHSALREGWDNPNVFQICTLKHSDSTTARRQEVGRGLRLAVNNEGVRMDAQVLGENLVHETNLLTVIASESYAEFVGALQRETKDVLYERPTKATVGYFSGKKLKVGDNVIEIDETQAASIIAYLDDNDYIDKQGHITEQYHKDAENNTLEPLPKKLREIAEPVHKLIQSIFDEHALDGMVDDADKPTVENRLNDNFKRKEFQELWNRINHKYAYTVKFDSDELVQKAIESINRELNVAQVRYTVTMGTQNDDITYDKVNTGTSFGNISTTRQNLRGAHACTTPYDLIGDIAKGATLTRRTAAKIISGIDRSMQMLFALNPEEFIAKVINLIKAQKATMIVDHIAYNRIEGEYESSIFTAEKHSQGYERAIQTKKHITDYLFTDGIAEESTEKKFSHALEAADDVVVYAKLPKGFHIPTPVGNYSPDWAIAFKVGTVRHIFFIAETKGSMDSMTLRKIEDAKIKCAEQLFNDISTSQVRYHKVDNYDHMLDVIQGLE